MLEVIATLGALLSIPAFGFQIYGWYVARQAEAARVENAVTAYIDGYDKNTLVLDEMPAPVAPVVPMAMGPVPHLHADTMALIAEVLSDRDAVAFSFVTTNGRVLDLIDSGSDVFLSDRFADAAAGTFADPTETLVLVEMVWLGDTDQIGFLVSPLDLEL